MLKITRTLLPKIIKQLTTRTTSAIIFKKNKIHLIGQRLNYTTKINQLITLNVNNIKLCNKNNCLIINTEVELYKYPYVWLRDNCQCKYCFHKQTNSRIIDWEFFHINNLQPKSVIFNNNNNNSDINSVKIIWNDNHETIFDINWLIKRNFNKNRQNDYLLENYRPKKIHWSNDNFNEILKIFDFNEVLTTDKSLLDWLEALTVHGVAMIRGAPITVNECRKLANRVNFIRKTHYGEEFTVRNTVGTTNVAYRSAKLQMHTDLPYYEYKPGANLLHCLVQSESNGGDNLLTDGFFVAEKMRIEYPEHYKILTEILVNWNDIGQENDNYFHSIYRAPVICIGRDGVLERINHSIPQRDSYFTTDYENVQKWYQAYAIFIKLIHEFTVKLKTQPGDILTFDNIRSLHGRSAYTDKASNTRHLVGVYLDWDEIYSRLRVLRQQKISK